MPSTGVHKAVQSGKGTYRFPIRRFICSTRQNAARQNTALLAIGFLMWEGDMETGKKHAGVKAGTSHARGDAGPAPQQPNHQAVRTYRVVLIKDGVAVGGRHRRRRDLAS
jgi:hypothetical protein